MRQRRWQLSLEAEPEAAEVAGVVATGEAEAAEVTTETTVARHRTVPHPKTNPPGIRISRLVMCPIFAPCISNTGNRHFSVMLRPLVLGRMYLLPENETGASPNLKKHTS